MNLSSNENFFLSSTLWSLVRSLVSKSSNPTNALVVSWNLNHRSSIWSKTDITFDNWLRVESILVMIATYMKKTKCPIYILLHGTKWKNIDSECSIVLTFHPFARETVTTNLNESRAIQRMRSHYHHIAIRSSTKILSKILPFKQLQLWQMKKQYLITIYSSLTFQESELRVTRSCNLRTLFLPCISNEQLHIRQTSSSQVFRIHFLRCCGIRIFTRRQLHVSVIKVIFLWRLRLSTDLGYLTLQLSRLQSSSDTLSSSSFFKYLKIYIDHSTSFREHRLLKVHVSLFFYGCPLTSSNDRINFFLSIISTERSITVQLTFDNYESRVRSFFVIVLIRIYELICTSFS